MNLFGWWKQTPREREKANAESMIRRVLPTLTLPSLEVEPGLWSVVGDVKHKYRVVCYLWVEDAMVHCVAASEIIVERGLLPRDLMLVVLEENFFFPDGSFRLIPQNEDRILGLARTVDSRYFRVEELGPLVMLLVDRMQRIVTKLYGLGLIIEGPDRQFQHTRPSRYPYLLR